MCAKDATSDCPLLLLPDLRLDSDDTYATRFACVYVSHAFGCHTHIHTPCISESSRRRTPFLPLGVHIFIFTGSTKNLYYTCNVNYRFPALVVSFETRGHTCLKRQKQV